VGQTAPRNTGTLSGAATNVSLTNPGNTIGTIGAYVVTGGNFQVVNSVTLAVNGAVSASNIFIETQPAWANKLLSLASTGSLTAANTGTISLVADALSVTAGARAPRRNSGVRAVHCTAIGVSGGGTLQIGASELGAVTGHAAPRRLRGRNQPGQQHCQRRAILSARPPIWRRATPSPGPSADAKGHRSWRNTLNVARWPPAPLCGRFHPSRRPTRSRAGNVAAAR
jgi:hypothetical protein